MCEAQGAGGVPSVVCPELEIVVNENLGMVYGSVRDLVRDLRMSWGEIQL
jgi:L-serine deaminase